MEDLLKEIGVPLIAVVVPVLVWGVKCALPNIPKVYLPILAGAFGPALEALGAQAMAADFTGWQGVAMGFVGNGLRELKDQVMKTLRGQGGPAGFKAA